MFVLTLSLFASIGPERGRPGSSPPSIWTIGLAIFALFVSHGLSYRLNYIGRGEYLRTSAANQMFAPYGRLVVLHITIIFGGLLIGLTGAPAAAIAVLIVLKTVIDLGLHFAERRRAVASPVS